MLCVASLSGRGHLSIFSLGHPLTLPPFGPHAGVTTSPCFLGTEGIPEIWAGGGEVTRPAAPFTFCFLTFPVSPCLPVLTLLCPAFSLQKIWPQEVFSHLPKTAKDKE